MTAAATTTTKTAPAIVVIFDGPERRFVALFGVVVPVCRTAVVSGAECRRLPQPVQCLLPPSLTMPQEGQTISFTLAGGSGKVASADAVPHREQNRASAGSGAPQFVQNLPSLIVPSLSYPNAFFKFSLTTPFSSFDTLKMGT
jgi:hypothetical protein